ncbi:MAG: SGNH/GDSL hydrolase family protein [Ruminococcaceae bacterium]|nr:SGNH/GDSL hydrolase family protein [Oscillospiraceae bacterium]
MMFRVLCKRLLPMMLAAGLLLTGCGGADNTDATTTTTGKENGTTATTRTPSTGIDPDKNNLKVLFVGNSFTEMNNMPNMFKKLVEKAGYTVTVDMIAWGGCTLTRYADPNDDAGAAFRGKLATSPDIVFLQDHSTAITSEDRQNEHIEAVKTLDEMVRAKGGKSIVLARAGWNHNCVSIPPSEQNAEVLKLSKRAGEAIGGAPIADVASAYEYVRQNFADINLYSSDDEHPSKIGSFLTACVAFSTLYDHSPVGLYNAGLNDSVTNTLQQVAAHVVFGLEVTPPDPDSDSESTNATPLPAGTYSAAESLKKSLAAGDVLMDEPWVPVYCDKARVNWEVMQTGKETFSFKATDWALPYVHPKADGGVVLNANQWADGGSWWDRAGIIFTAPADQDVILTSGDIKTISAGGAGQLTTTEARVAIYLNGTKIWPADADYAAINRNTSVNFPELPLSLKKGDMIAIEGYGAVPGGKITDSVNSAWNNQVIMDPVIVVPDDK